MTSRRRTGPLGWCVVSGGQSTETFGEWKKKVWLPKPWGKVVLINTPETFTRPSTGHWTGISRVSQYLDRFLHTGPSLATFSIFKWRDLSTLDNKEYSKELQGSFFLLLNIVGQILQLSNAYSCRRSLSLPAERRYSMVSHVFVLWWCYGQSGSEDSDSKCRKFWQSYALFLCKPISLSILIHRAAASVLYSRLFSPNNSVCYYTQFSFPLKVCFSCVCTWCEC